MAFSTLIMPMPAAMPTNHHFSRRCAQMARLSAARPRAACSWSIQMTEKTGAVSRIGQATLFQLAPPCDQSSTLKTMRAAVTRMLAAQAPW
jgi:hypothetical protein